GSDGTALKYVKPQHYGGEPLTGDFGAQNQARTATQLAQDAQKLRQGGMSDIVPRTHRLGPDSNVVVQEEVPHTDQYSSYDELGPAEKQVANADMKARESQARDILGPSRRVDSGNKQNFRFDKSTGKVTKWMGPTDAPDPDLSLPGAPKQYDELG